MPFEPRKPFAEGEAVTIVPGAEVGGEEAERREVLMAGCGLK